jgi:hypothetical protein
MASFTVTHTQRVDGYAVVQTLEGTDIGVGSSIVVTGTTGFNGTFTVLNVPTGYYTGVDEQGDWTFDDNEIILNQLLVANAGADVERAAMSGTLTWSPVCTWITSADVLAWLGISVATANDTTFVGACTDAANAFAFRRRREAGYFDSLSTAPSADVKLGTIMMAGVLYRERGSVDSFQSFGEMAISAPIGGTMGQINRLLGVNRSRVA